MRQNRTAVSKRRVGFIYADLRSSVVGATSYFRYEGKSNNNDYPILRWVAGNASYNLKVITVGDETFKGLTPQHPFQLYQLDKADRAYLAEQGVTNPQVEERKSKALVVGQLYADHDRIKTLLPVTAASFLQFLGYDQGGDEYFRHVAGPESYSYCYLFPSSDCVFSTRAGTGWYRPTKAENNRFRHLLADKELVDKLRHHHNLK